MRTPPEQEKALGPTTGIAAFVVALLIYVALGLVLKSAVLNWIVGPLFPLFTLYLLPSALRRGRRRRRG